MDPTAKLAAFWNIPILGHVASADYLADKVQFPTLVRVTLTMAEMGKALVEFIKVKTFDSFQLRFCFMI